MLCERGDLPTGQVVPFPFPAYAATGASITISGLAVTDIEIYKGTSGTQRASDNGYALLDTDGIDIWSRTGIHGFSIDFSDNSDPGFYSAGSFYYLIVDAITVDGVTVRFVYTFSLGFNLRPATAGRTLNVSSGGVADGDMVAISGDTSAADEAEKILDGTGGMVRLLSSTSTAPLRIENTHASGSAVAINWGSGFALSTITICSDGYPLYLAQDTGTGIAAELALCQITAGEPQVLYGFAANASGDQGLIELAKVYSDGTATGLEISSVSGDFRSSVVTAWSDPTRALAVFMNGRTDDTGEQSIIELASAQDGLAVAGHYRAEDADGNSASAFLASTGAEGYPAGGLVAEYYSDEESEVISRATFGGHSAGNGLAAEFYTPTITLAFADVSQLASIYASHVTILDDVTIDDLLVSGVATANDVANDINIGMTSGVRLGSGAHGSSTSTLRLGTASNTVPAFYVTNSNGTAAMFESTGGTGGNSPARPTGFAMKGTGTGVGGTGMSTEGWGGQVAGESCGWYAAAIGTPPYLVAGFFTSSQTFVNFADDTRTAGIIASGGIGTADGIKGVAGSTGGSSILGSGPVTMAHDSNDIDLGSAQRALIATAVLTTEDGVDGLTLIEFMRLGSAALAGPVSGGGSSTETFRNVTDTKDRIVSTVDEDGNRTAVTLDLT